MKSSEYGLLLNKARKGKYSNFQDMVYLIRYVTRTNGKPDNDLITWGGIGVAEFTGTEGMTRQFEDVQKMLPAKLRLWGSRSRDIMNSGTP